MKMKSGKFKECTQTINEWTQKMKEWTMKNYLLIEKDIAYVIFPASSTMMLDPIGIIWDGAT